MASSLGNVTAIDWRPCGEGKLNGNPPGKIVQLLTESRNPARQRQCQAARQTATSSRLAGYPAEKLALLPSRADDPVDICAGLSAEGEQPFARKLRHL